MAISIVSFLQRRTPRADLVAVRRNLPPVRFVPAPAPSTTSPSRPVGLLTAIVPAQGSEDLARVDGITVFTVSDLATAIRVAFLRTRNIRKRALIREEAH